MRAEWSLAAPTVILAAGLLVSRGVSEQHAPELRLPLEAAVPTALGGYDARDVTISEEEASAGGATSYLYRSYSASSGESVFTVYIGYYASQAYGRTIHSPKNCLPGAGWQALSAGRIAVPTETGVVEVNRYLVQNGDQQALAFYWYQGRGRVEASEYRVKWDLLIDAGRTGRSEEALVRVLVPVTGDEAEAEAIARRATTEVIPRIATALPS